MKKAAIRAKLHGVEFIVTDMEELEHIQSNNQEDVEDNRLYPYLYLVSPLQVKYADWPQINLESLIYIKYSTVENTTIK